MGGKSQVQHVFGRRMCRLLIAALAIVWMVLDGIGFIYILRHSLRSPHVMIEPL